MRYLVPFLLISLIAGCESVMPAPIQQVGPSVPAAQDDSCDAGALAGLIGQDATALERVLRLGPVRVIRPGTAITMDFRPDRINFDINANNQISRIFCG